MTVGERILQKRKELGLSQEALGEKLGVSRQAIYKWESDATLPEIEKLVALSHIFSVTVGELLGVEEPHGQPEAPELTDSQIRMVEEIVSRYQPQSRPGRRWPRVLAAVLILAMAVSTLTLSSRLRSLQDSYHQLQSSVSLINTQVDSQISTITSRVEQVLNKVNSFTTDQSAQVQSLNLEDNTVTFSLRATPKTYTEGMTVRFQATAGGETIQVPAVAEDNQTYSGTVTVPLTDEKTELSVVFLSGSRQDLQPITAYWNLYQNSFPRLILESPPLFFCVYEDVLSSSFSVTVLDDTPQSDVFSAFSLPELTQVRVGLFADGVLVRWLQEEPSQEGSEPTFLLDEGVRLDREKAYCIAAVLTDEFGRELVLSDYASVYREDDWLYPAGDLFLHPEKWVY